MPPKMRTIPQIVEELKQQDESTAITEHYLRKLVKTGCIPSVKVNRKTLLCVDTVYKYLENPMQEPQNQPETGVIRKVVSMYD